MTDDGFNVGVLYPRQPQPPFQPGGRRRRSVTESRKEFVL